MTYTFFRRRLLTQYRPMYLVVVEHPTFPFEGPVGMNQKTLYYGYVCVAQIDEREQ
jgi:hypothetical protein